MSAGVGRWSFPRPAAPASPYLLVLLTTLFWGGTAVAGKLVIRAIPPFTTGVLRYSAAALLLGLVFARDLPSPRALGRRDVVLLAWLGILGTTFNHGFFFLGLVWAPAAHGAIIPPTTSSVAVMLLAAALGGEPLDAGRLGGSALCLVGVVLVARPERLLAGVGGGTILGDLCFLLGGVSWGVYSYLTKIALRRLSAPTALAFGMTMGTVVLVPAALAERPWHALAVAPAGAWLALLYLTVAGTVLSFLWWNVAIRASAPRGPPSSATSSRYSAC